MRSLGTFPDMPRPPVRSSRVAGSVETASPAILAIGRQEGEGDCTAPQSSASSNRSGSSSRRANRFTMRPMSQASQIRIEYQGRGVPWDGATFEDRKEVDPEGATVVGELATEPRQIRR